jgi:hypothetical protein
MIDLTKDELNKLYEGAKNDRFIVVASEVRQMVGMIRRANDRIEQLEAALWGLYEFNVKHQPDLIDTRIMLIARAALAPEQDK